MPFKKSLKLSILISAILLSFSINSLARNNNNNELVILNWADYLDPEIIKAFENKYNAKVHEVYYESDDTRDDMLVESNGTDYDLVLSSGSALKTYKKRDWLTPFGKKQVPNIKHIKKKWRNAFENSSDYSIPYFWGTLGIAYREDLVKKPITSWKQLFEPEEELHQKILIADSVNDIIGMALKSLGFSSNSHNKNEYKQVEELLLKQKEHVKTYGYLALNEKSALVKGDVIASMAYSGDALILIDIEPKIKYIVPVEGGGLWVDYFAVLKSSKNKELAFKFLNFINIPENAAQLAEFVYYASPNNAAEKLLPKEFLDDQTIYPDKKTLNASEFNKAVPAKIKRYKNSILSHLTN